MAAPAASGSARDLPANLLSMAQRGQHDEAIADAERFIVDARLSDDDRMIAMHSLAIALAYANRLDDALAAADRSIGHAAEIGSLGWEANVYASRADVRATAGDTEGALQDLIDAEVLLEGCADPGLRNWAHSALGTAYANLRLFELALPHFELAPTIAEQPVPLDEGPVIDAFNLADLHLRWAAELERLGLADPGRRDEHGHHLAAAREWIDTGDRLVSGLAGNLWETAFGRLRAQADSTVDPESSVDVLVGLRAADLAAGRLADAIQANSHLARALRLLGRPAEALAASRDAVSLLSDEMEMTTRLDAYHQLHETQCALDLPGSVEMRRYVQLNSELLWAHRLRTVEGVRARRDFALLQAEHAFSSRLAREDPLTGVHNRRGLDEWFDEHPEGPATMVVIDVDDFKQINDAFGHEVGDRVLKRVAHAVSSSARAEDVVARLGGDEFVILMDRHGVTSDELCDRVADAVSALDLSDVAPGLVATASIGAAWVPAGESTGSLFSQADSAMFATKRGRTHPSWRGLRDV